MENITFESADILEVKVDSNGIMGGDSGHGGYLSIKLKSTNQFYVNESKTYELELFITGDSERENMRDAFRFMADYLDQKLTR
jgi:hypothetical protein